MGIQAKNAAGSEEPPGRQTVKKPVLQYYKTDVGAAIRPEGCPNIF